MARHTMMFIATVLGLFFIYSGFAKLNPMLNADLHSNMKKHFVNYARVAPLRTYFDKRFKASDYRQFVGGMEIAGGTGMVLLSGRLSLPASQLIVLLSAAFMIHTHIVLGDPVARAATLIATSLMVVVQMLFTIFSGKSKSPDDAGKKKRRSSDASDEKETKKDIPAPKNEKVIKDGSPREKSKAKKQTPKKKKTKAN
ncbi:transmembrane protein 35A-like [Patiria miniata]|uniref:Novel acetylcholine receptor chaperone n=1 Tax=Patiria miniata TaxID=46514 RepID=A0A914A797_PATMI|nr:transmembrane protein 35A-like [Patiria miniata]